MNESDAKAEILGHLMRDHTDSKGLNAFIQANYDRTYLSLYGLKGAYISRICHVCDENNLGLPFDTVLRIAREIYAEGFRWGSSPG